MKRESIAGMSARRILMIFGAMVLCVICVACDNSDLRGTWHKSKDGKTYLDVVDDNGGDCGGIRVDGKPWTHRIGEAALIDPGTHTINCSGDIEFSIPSGSVYKFNYWGP